MPRQPDLIAEGLRVVHEVARRLFRRFDGRVAFDDLVELGNFSVLEVARAYDPSRASFDAYASMRFKWLIIDGLRRETHSRTIAGRLRAVIASERFADAMEARPAEPTTEEEDLSALDKSLRGHAAAMFVGLMARPQGALVAEDAETPEELALRAETAAVLGGIVDGLPPRERTLLRRHYWEGERFDVVAAELGISKSWASRVHKAAIETCHAALERTELAMPERRRRAS